MQICLTPIPCLFHKLPLRKTRGGITNNRSAHMTVPVCPLSYRHEGSSARKEPLPTADTVLSTTASVDGCSDLRPGKDRHWLCGPVSGRLQESPSHLCPFPLSRAVPSVFTQLCHCSFYCFNKYLSGIYCRLCNVADGRGKGPGPGEACVVSNSE